MLHALFTQRGQTAAEYMGVLLLTAMLIATIAATGLGQYLARETGRQICLLVNARADCPPSQEELERRAERKKRAAARKDSDGDGVPDRQERRHGTDPNSRDSDRDGVSDPTELRTGTHRDGVLMARAASPWKKVACEAAKKAASGVDIAFGTPMRDLVDKICGGIKKAENAVVQKAIRPIIARFCARKATALPNETADICRTAISRMCGALNGIDKRACGWVKEAACWVSELDVFCTKKQKADKRKQEADKRAQERLDRRRAEQRKDRDVETPGGGSLRMLGRDQFNRARGIEARVTPATVRHRRDKDREGEATARDVPGLKKAECMQRGHLLARVLGGHGSDPRNFIPLPDSVNGTPMAALERRFAEAAAEGRELSVKVVPEYQGSDPVPVRVHITVTTLKKRRGLNDFTYSDKPLPVPRPFKCNQTRPRNG